MIAEVSCSHLDTFIEKTETRSLTTGIVGLGYVGLPLAHLFASQGFKVLGLDIDRTKTRKLMRGESYIGHIPASVVQGMRENDRLVATSDLSYAGQADTLSICVPTPLDKARQPDLTAVRNTAESLVSHRYGRLPGAELPELTDDALLDADATLILTDHDAFDYERIVRLSKTVIDTRNATGNVAAHRDKIILA